MDELCSGSKNLHFGPLSSAVEEVDEIDVYLGR